jgi:hypothetical protein
MDVPIKCKIHSEFVTEVQDSHIENPGPIKQVITSASETPMRWHDAAGQHARFTGRETCYGW